MGLFRRLSKLNASQIMKQASPEASAQPRIENARDLLLRLYGDIGISAVAAAVEMARQPAPEHVKDHVKHELPAVLRDDLAA
jgi:hypothetical protein